MGVFLRLNTTPQKWVVTVQNLSLHAGESMIGSSQ
ncbi:hypothetical protein F4553_005346 [Allocatelliglobosispora scoriae]|uniref:Uncharacterized protein n=1 Tax=Allocatelliglobosispora scoriae TaxID=643052 RepID=A0A841BSD0_9ACTN|nr:hypothetical protein [Allocatelliglobosispora scoriae]